MRFLSKLVSGVVAAVGFCCSLCAQTITNPINFLNFAQFYPSDQQLISTLALSNHVTMTFGWQIQTMDDYTAPSGSTETISCSAGSAITFQGGPVIVRSFAAMNNGSGAEIQVVAKRNGVQVWSYNNTKAGQYNWVSVTTGSGKMIDELDFPQGWNQRYTDFYIQDASGANPPTNSPNIYYVDGTNSAASDMNPGTQAQPWKTIQLAANLMQAGDTVYVKAGNYTNNVVPAASGASNAWITYSAYPGQEQQAVIDHAQFAVNQQSYISIMNFRVQYSPGVGISVLGPGGNYNIVSNYTYDTGSSGIAVWGGPWLEAPSLYSTKAVTNVTISFNTIEKACDGGYNEQLDIANGVDNFLVCSNILKNGTNAVNGGEGIDCKEGASNGKICGNQIYNLLRYGIYIEAGSSPAAYYPTPALLTNLEIFGNCVHNNTAHGIGVTSEGLGDMNGIKVYNNVCFSNSADGILLYDYGLNASSNYASNITIINNTTYNNNVGRYYGGIAIDHHYAQNVIERNNVCYETLNGAFGVKTPENGSLTVADHNISTTTTNPGYLNVATGDFHLASNSPAINAGSSVLAPLFDFDGSARPYGPAFDIGAYEYYPASPFSLSIQPYTGQACNTLILQGGPESHYQVQWSAGLDPAAWATLLNIPTLPYSPYMLSDTNAMARNVQRFYRAVLLKP